MPDNFFGGQGATLLTAIIIVAVALLALVGVFWLLRARASSTFIRGGKNRQPRLAVLDATAVDTRRRLVLIRRDDVEHLVMIGGPTDIVIESRIPRQADQTPFQAAAPQQQQTAQPAPTKRAAALQQPRGLATPPERTVEPPVDRAPPQPTAGSQSSLSALAPAAATTATISATSSIQSEAADVLDSARTRVFEEPDFDENSFDDLTAVPPPTTRAHPTASARNTPAPQSPEPSVAPSTQAPAATSAEDIERAEAANLLENARTRVFEESSFDESAFDELTAVPAPAAQTSPTTAAPNPAPVSASISQPRPSPSDFESVLAEELSQDLTFDAPDDSFFAQQYGEHQLDQSEVELIEAPDVKPEPQPSRDSLEAEMERLLGDLSRKP